MIPVFTSYAGKKKDRLLQKIEYCGRIQTLFVAIENCSNKKSF